MKGFKKIKRAYNENNGGRNRYQNATKGYV